MQIDDVAECVSKAIDSSFNPSSIEKGFQKTGIFPFDRTVFKAIDLLTSTVTSTVNPSGVVISRSMLDTFEPDSVDNTLKDPIPNFLEEDSATDGSPSSGESTTNDERSPINDESLSW